MKLENFKIVKVNNQQIIEIEYHGDVFDLHNAAEFVRIDYVIKPSMLKLFWRYYYDETNIIQFQIRFNDIIYFEITSRDSEMPTTEDDCLEEIIYNEKIEFRFMGGMKIIIKADKVYFEKKL